MKHIAGYLPFLLVAFVVMSLVASLFNNGLGGKPYKFMKTPLPQFTMGGIKGYGDGFSSDEIKAEEEITLITVFASWCAACNVNHETLNRASLTLDVPLFGVMIDTDIEKANAWLEEKEIPFDFIGHDPKMTLLNAIGKRGIPQTLVVDDKGQIRMIYSGAMDTKDFNSIVMEEIKRLKRISSSRPSEDINGESQEEEETEPEEEDDGYTDGFDNDENNDNDNDNEDEDDLNDEDEKPSQRRRRR